MCQRLRVTAAPEIDLSQAAFDGCVLSSFPRLVKDAGIGIHGLLIMDKRLVVSRHAARLLRRFEKELKRLGPILRTGIVESKQAGHFAQSIREKELDTFSHPLVNKLPALDEDALVHRFLRQR